MKITNLILMAGAALTMVSCGADATTDEPTTEMKTMTVDSQNSRLGWKGSKSPEYFHTGSVSITEGSAEFVDGNMASGTFTVDLTTMKAEDEMLPEDKKAMLVGHLSSPDFFNVAENSKVTVKTGALENGMLPTTISFMGQDIKQTIPVKMTMMDKGAMIEGSFDVDFSALMIPGFQPKEGETEHVLPVISFDLKLALK